MATVTSAPPVSATPPTPTPAQAAMELYRFTVDEYERMDFIDERVELINGYVVKKVSKNPKHPWTTKKVLKALERLLPPTWTSRQEAPVRIPDFDEPEPDVSVVRGNDDDYEHRHPEPADVGLVVEVSESSLDYDRNAKLPAYARGRIPVYWIVNLVDRQVEVYSDPVPDGYRSKQVFTAGQSIPVMLDGQVIGQIAVDDILR
jgi:Uma2 family endonuclease